MKILKFGTKNVLFGFFGTGIGKYYHHIVNQCPRSFLIAKFGSKRKILKFGIKNALFGYFSTGIRKRYCHI